MNVAKISFAIYVFTQSHFMFYSVLDKWQFLNQHWSLKYFVKGIVLEQGLPKELPEITETFYSVLFRISITTCGYKQTKKLKKNYFKFKMYSISCLCGHYSGQHSFREILPKYIP